MNVQKMLTAIGVVAMVGASALANAQTVSSGSGAVATAASSGTASKKQMRKEDRALARSVKNALRKVKGIDVANVRVISRDGVVSIIGNVREQAQIDAATAAASKVAGVKRLDNQLAVGDPGH
jgi:hyperosmotically inducible protein